MAGRAEAGGRAGRAASARPPPRSRALILPALLAGNAALWATLSFCLGHRGGPAGPQGVPTAQAGAPRGGGDRLVGDLAPSFRTPGARTPRGRGAADHVLVRLGLPVDLSSLQVLIDDMPAKVSAMGALGPAYFYLVYVLAECLALPATPLTLSAGYLFGLPVGFGVTLAAGCTAAGIGFMLSRTVLRPQFEKVAEGNDTFEKINKAVEREGFKIILLLRLTPLLPFALSNYFYGLSKVGFLDFISATFLGFFPGTLALVASASTAQALAAGDAEQPWYVYAAGAAVTLAMLKAVTTVAQQAVDEAVQESEEFQAAPSRGSSFTA